MLKTAAKAAELFDRYERFDADMKIAQDVDALWLIECRSQAKDDKNADTAIARLSQLGFTETDRHVGSLESVSRWVRTS